MLTEYSKHGLFPKLYLGLDLLFFQDIYFLFVCVNAKFSFEKGLYALSFMNANQQYH